MALTPTASPAPLPQPAPTTPVRPLASPASDVLQPLIRHAAPPDATVRIGRGRWHLREIADVEPAGRGTRPDRAPAAALAGAVVARLDAAVPQWRTVPAGTRRVDIVAQRIAPSDGPGMALSGFDLLDWLSPRWQRRIDSGRWHFVDGSGRVADPAALDRYGRAGGIVAFARGETAPPSATPGATAADTEPAEALFTGDRRAWTAALADVRTALIQLGLASVPAARNAGDPAAVEADGVVAELIELAVSWWHPAFAWHVDVVDLVARGVSNARFAEPAYAALAGPVVASLAAALAARGISSAPVQLA
ncbi:MAG: hypothetical protein ACE367_06190 [Acidimicrobiales bacterium]